MYAVYACACQVDKYVDPARLKSADWLDVVANESALRQNFEAYIATPLLEFSEDL